ncbi:MAG: hypothetical protein K2X27_18100 [Candidatus Obscuribacterales bacterium]|nr:hypothetical protein [Candidatus Obscuribacterales bacterium]
MVFGNILFYVLVGIAALIVLSFIFSCVVITQQNTKRIVQRFGKFKSIRSAGFTLKLGWFDSASKEISLRTQQFDVSELTYTNTGTSVTISAQVQYRVDDNDASVCNAFYKLANPEAQIHAHVASAIRSKVPTMSLEEVQTNQRGIASHVKTDLTETMRQYGYIIEDVLVTEADPDEAIVKANNDKYASELAKQTVVNQAEAQYRQTVRAAEADRDAMKAHGEGIALERAAITEGFEKSIKALESAVHGANAQDVLALIGFQQYIEAQVKIGADSGSKVIFLNGNPGASSEIMNALRQTLISSTEATRESRSETADD